MVEIEFHQLMVKKQLKLVNNMTEKLPILKCTSLNKFTESHEETLIEVKSIGNNKIGTKHVIAFKQLL